MKTPWNALFAEALSVVIPAIFDMSSFHVSCAISSNASLKLSTVSSAQAAALHVEGFWYKLQSYYHECGCGPAGPWVSLAWKEAPPQKKKLRGLVENLKKEKDVTVSVTQFDWQYDLSKVQYFSSHLFLPQVGCMQLLRCLKPKHRYFLWHFISHFHLQCHLLTW